MLSSQLLEAEQILLQLQSKSSKSVVLDKNNSLTHSTLPQPSRSLNLSKKEFQSRYEQERSEYKDELVKDTVIAEAACKSLEEIKTEAYRHLDHKTDVKANNR